MYFLSPLKIGKIKSGVIQSAAYNINVNSGQASGNLRVAYNDLAIAISNKNTRIDKGTFKSYLQFRWAYVYYPHNQLAG